MVSLSDLTISIVSHGHGHYLDELLDDLQSAGVIEKSNVIVTLNVPDVVFPVDKWKNAGITWVVNNEPKGFGANHNHALLSATTSWVLVLNPDIRINDNALEEILAIASNLSNVGVVAPCIKSGSGELEDSVRQNLTPVSLIVRYLHRKLTGRSKSEIGLSNSFDWFAGMFLLMPSEVFVNVYGFDERFFLYCEDYDICVRICLNHRYLFLDDTHMVIHNAQRASHSELKYLIWHLKSLIKVWCSSAFWKYTLSKAFGILPKVKRASDKY